MQNITFDMNFFCSAEREHVLMLIYHVFRRFCIMLFILVDCVPHSSESLIVYVLESI